MKMISFSKLLLCPFSILIYSRIYSFRIISRFRNCNKISTTRVKNDPNDIAELLRNFIQEQRGFNKKQETFNKVFVRKLDAFSSTLGRRFEAYNKMVLEILLDLDYDIAPDLKSIVLPDPNGEVNPTNKEVEIDLFCLKPLLIGECTTFLQADTGIAKIERFIRTKNFVHRIYHEEPKSYFFTYQISPEIENEVKALLKSAEIKLITSSAEHEY